MATSKIYCSLDLEGTGLDPTKDAMIEVGAVLFHFDASGSVVWGKEFSQLIKPPIPVPPFIQDLTGIRESDLVGKPVWEEIREDFKSFVGDHVILGQNIQFDLTFLASAGLGFPQGFIDTKELAQIFTPHLRYFNLEYLLKTLGKPLTSHHRALDDSKSAVELLALLIKEFHTLTPTTQARIQDLLKASRLNWRTLFKPKKSSRAIKTIVQGSLFEAPKAPLAASSAFKPHQSLAVPLGPGYSFFETGYADFTKESASQLIAGQAKSGGTVLSLGDAVEMSKVMALLSPGSFIELRNPEDYICQSRLESVLRLKNKPDMLNQFLVKTLVWQERRSMAQETTVMPVSGPEFGLRSAVCGDYKLCLEHSDDEQVGCELSRALRAMQERKNVITHHSAWIRLARLESPRIITRGIFWNAIRLEEALVTSDTQTVSLRSTRSLLLLLYDPQTKQGLCAQDKDVASQVELIMNATDLCFGLLSVKFSELAQHVSQLLVTKAVREEVAFASMRSTIENLLRNMDELVGSDKLDMTDESSEIGRIFSELRLIRNQINDFFFSSTEARTHWFDFFSGRLKLRSRPRRTSISILGGLESTIITDACIPQAVVEYWQREYEIPAPQRKSYEPQSSLARLWLAAGLPEKEHPNARKLTYELFERTARHLSGRTVVLLNSNYLLEACYEYLQTTDLKPRLIVQKFTGHSWKNLELYQANEQAIWLMTSSHFLKQTSIFPPTGSLVLMSIPYDTPGIFDALYAKEKIFRDVILPRTSMRLVSICSRGISAVIPKALFDLYVFDPRIMSGYNSSLLQALTDSLKTTPQSFPNTQTVVN